MSFYNKSFSCGLGRLLSTSFLGLALFLAGCDSCEDESCDDPILADDVDCFVNDGDEVRPCTEDDDVSVVEVPNEDLTLPPVGNTVLHCYSEKRCAEVEAGCNKPGQEYSETKKVQEDGSVSIHGVCTTP